MSLHAVRDKPKGAGFPAPFLLCHESVRTVNFLFFAVFHGALALLALTAFPALPAAALCLFVVEAVTAFDNGVTVAGNRLGIRPGTERVNRARFFLHAVCIGLLVPVYAAIGNELAFAAAWQPVVTTLAWVLAAGLCVYGYRVQYCGTGAIMPVSYYGCLRYAQSVSSFTRHPDYDYSPAELDRRGKLPLASVLTTLVGLVISVFIAWLGDFWVPLIVTALMFVAGAFPSAHGARWPPRVSRLFTVRAWSMRCWWPQVPMHEAGCVSLPQLFR